jgi:glycosyltransferase involved in cell wall biosynthesis
MRVLHVISNLDRRVGGPATALLGMALAGSDAGLDVTILTAYRAGEELPSAEQLRSVRLRSVGPCTGPLLRCPALALDVADAVSRADIVHVHGVWEEIQHAAARSAAAARIPYLLTPHGMLDRWSLRQKRLKKLVYLRWRGRRMLRRAAALHCTSRAEAEQVEALRPGPPVIVEPLGIDWEEFAHVPPPGTFRRAHPRTVARPLIVFLGRVHPGKGVEHLIPALAACEDRNAMLAVVGPDSGGFAGQMRALAETAGVADRVLFTGMLRGADRLAALADADVFALPSDHENFGLAVVEALAVGTPVVVSEHVNIQREIAGAGVGAVSSTDAAALARTLDRWLGDRAFRAAAAARARPFARSTYDWTQIARNWRGHYERVAGAAAATGGPRVVPA